MLRPSRKKRSDGKGSRDYATHSDFCAVFLQQLDRLYSLALILTGDELRAEECLLAAFDACVGGRLVFKESASSWSIRSVIKTAIRLMLPVRSDPFRLHFPGNDISVNLDQEASLKYVQGLPLFDRFVFVMSVLERYSDPECAVLLDCSSTDILPARIRAFRQVSRLEKIYPDHGMQDQFYVVDADGLECG